MTENDPTTEALEALASLSDEPGAQPVLSWKAVAYVRRLPARQRTAWTAAYRAELARRGHPDAAALTPHRQRIT